MWRAHVLSSLMYGYCIITRNTRKSWLPTVKFKGMCFKDVEIYVSGWERSRDKCKCNILPLILSAASLMAGCHRASELRQRAHRWCPVITFSGTALLEKFTQLYDSANNKKIYTEKERLQFS